MKQFLLGSCTLLVFGLAACFSQPAADGAGTIRIRWARDPENLDPLVAPNPNSLEAINLLYCSLLTVDYEQRKFVPWLAEAMPQVAHEDSLTLVTYRIRPEATWDSSHAVLARDVALTLKMMFCPGLPNEAFRAQYGFIRDIRLDPADSRRFTVVFRGRAPELVQASGDYSIFPEYLLDPEQKLRLISLPELRSIDSTASKYRPALAAFAQRYQKAQLSRHSVGCGPYVVADWQTGRYLTLKRKAHWWGSRVAAAPAQLQANPAAINYEIIADDATALLALRRGDVDVYPMVPARDFIRLRQNQQADSTLRFYTSDSYDMLTAGFNTRKPELQDPITRQALSYLFDIPGLIEASQQGMAYPSASLVSPKIKRFYNDSLPLLTFAPQKAKALLLRAGWRQQPQGWTRPSASGAPQYLRPAFSYRAGDPAYEAIVLQFRAAAASIGLQVQPRPTEASLLTKQLRAGEVDIYLQLLSGNPFVYNFAPILHSQNIGWGNFTGFGSAASDQLIDAIATEEDPERQARLLRKFQALLREQCPMVVLFFLQHRLAAARHLSNLHVTGIRPGYEAAAIKSQQPAMAQR
jgi:ABC-type transport system substrate-binding protein